MHIKFRTVAQPYNSESSVLGKHQPNLVTARARTSFITACTVRVIFRTSAEYIGRPAPLAVINVLVYLGTTYYHSGE